MAGETRPDILTDAEYQRMIALLGATAKGRIFLAEYGRQARAQDTRSLFAALAAIESSLAVVREQLRPEVVAGEIGHIATALCEELEQAGAAGPARGDRQAAAVAKACAELMALAQALCGGADGARSQPRADADPGPAEAG